MRIAKLVAVSGWLYGVTDWNSQGIKMAVARKQRKDFGQANALSYAASEHYKCERSKHTIDRLSVSACVSSRPRQGRTIAFSGSAPHMILVVRVIYLSVRREDD